MKIYALIDNREVDTFENMQLFLRIKDAEDQKKYSGNSVFLNVMELEVVE